MHGFGHVTVSLPRALRGAVVLGTAAVLLGGVQSPSSDRGSVLLRAVRSYRGEHRTQIDAFLQVPYGWIAPVSDAPSGVLSYQVSVRVTDSTGLTLLKESWQNHADAS